MIRTFLVLVTSIFFLGGLRISQAQSGPYNIELETVTLPGSPAIHSFAFAESNGRWLFIGGRTNGLHGFTPFNSFPKQFSNKNIFVVDPNSMQTWSRNIFSDLPFAVADPLRSTNMQYAQTGNKLYIIGGFGYDSLTNSFITFSSLTVIDVEETIQAIINGTSVNSHIKQMSDSRLRITGGELHKLGDYFYLIGGHNFSGNYRRTVNTQVYSNQIRKFMINDNGVEVSISGYSAITDTVEYHRRDMNVVPAIMPDGITEYLTLYGGVFKHGRDLPFLNPIYIYENSADVDYSFEQKLNQYTCAHLTAFSSATGSMHTSFFGGMSLYYYNESTQTLEVDSLIPFTDDITTLSKYPGGNTMEYLSDHKMPALLGTNAQFIMNNSVPHFDNEVIKLSQISGRTFVGYIYGGIRALLPNNGLSYPSEYIFKVYITPEPVLPVELTSLISTVAGRNVSLNWTTSFEENNSGFEIHRSSEESDWSIIGFVHGYGNSTINHYYSFNDVNLTSGNYKYRLKQIDFNGNYNFHYLTNNVIIGIPEKFFLSQNYPNPFNPFTIINYQITISDQVSIKIYDFSGKEVAQIINEIKGAGFYSIKFQPKDLPSGVYYYKIESGSFTDTKKMVLLK
ncbi:MAG: T9SS type A sorting domain-containing protein [Ignavibacteria bacterium]